MDNTEEQLNEYDESKRILDIIRESNYNNKKNRFKGSLLTEAVQPDNIKLDSSEQKVEEKKFRDIISPRVNFDPLIIYPKTGNVEWGGSFQDSKIQWFYSLDDTRGVYISCELLKLDDSTITTIKKLVGFYDNWANTWANKIADEYRNDETEVEGEIEDVDGIGNNEEGLTGEEPPVGKGL
jgi:hypothetical protein